MAIRRTTIEIDDDLLARAKRALGLETTRATVEEALRQAAQRADTEFADRAERQRQLLRRIPDMVDVDVLASDDMWR
jgi:Arc/MetJ family transcription regulator